MKIRVNEIAIEPGVAIREATDEETIQRYMETLEKLPPIAVFHTDEKYILADGFHRWAAAVMKGWEYIEAEVKEGSLEEASEFSITANLKHGRPLTSSEYEKALRRLRVLHPNWTQEKLGETLSRSQRWVSYVLAADSVGEFVAAAAKLDYSLVISSICMSCVCVHIIHACMQKKPNARSKFELSMHSEFNYILYMCFKFRLI